MRSAGLRIAGVVVVTLLICVGLALYIGLYLTNTPPSVSAAQGPGGANLYLATVPAAATDDPHPTWVSYYATDAGAGHWSRATTFDLPAHTLVHVTIYQFDSASGLRNPFIAQATGTSDGTFQLDGKSVQTINPDDASHVFAIPQMGVSVPLQGISSDAKNPCSNAPCELKNDHHTISFTFMTPGKGLYRWQCFVPCAAGYVQGFGGPMQTEGYMDGFIKVV